MHVKHKGHFEERKKAYVVMKPPPIIETRHSLRNRLGEDPYSGHDWNRARYYEKPINNKWYNMLVDEFASQHARKRRILFLLRELMKHADKKSFPAADEKLMSNKNLLSYIEYPNASIDRETSHGYDEDVQSNAGDVWGGTI